MKLVAALLFGACLALVAAMPDTSSAVSTPEGPPYPALAASSPPTLVPPAWAPAPAPHPYGPPPDTSALSAVVVDEGSGAVLYEKDAHLALPPASLTKIATAIIALRDGDLDAWVDVDVDSTLMPGSTVMGLLPGDRFTLRDLLYGLMLPSGNDAALAIGRHVAGSDAAFVARMNVLAWNLGLRDTHFTNPHGLSGPEHLTSAYDLAVLARYAMGVPGFAELVQTRSWTARGSRDIDLRNINGFLLAYPDADGVKTGYTRRAGLTLAASATRQGHRVYVVLLNAPQRNADATALMNWAFGNFLWPSGQ